MGCVILAAGLTLAGIWKASASSNKPEVRCRRTAHTDHCCAYQKPLQPNMKADEIQTLIKDEQARRRSFKD